MPCITMHHLTILLVIICKNSLKSIVPNNASRMIASPWLPTRAVLVNIRYHFLNFFLLWLKPQGPHRHLLTHPLIIFALSNRKYVQNIIVIPHLHDRTLLYVSRDPPYIAHDLLFICHTFSSLASMVPVPSVSNKSKASLISVFCSSVSSILGAKRGK